MRRISSVTKDAICYTRSTVVMTEERSEAMSQHYAPETYAEIREIHEAMIEGCRNTVAKLIALEVKELTDEFGLTEKFMKSAGSAFPDCTELGDVTMIGYMSDLVEDAIELISMPAIEVADEFEDWLNDLWEYHEAKRNSEQN